MNIFANIKPRFFLSNTQWEECFQTYNNLAICSLTWKWAGYNRQYHVHPGNIRGWTERTKQWNYWLTFLSVDQTLPIFLYMMQMSRKWGFTLWFVICNPLILLKSFSLRHQVTDEIPKSIRVCLLSERGEVVLTCLLYLFMKQSCLDRTILFRCRYPEHTHVCVTVTLSLLQVCTSEASALCFCQKCEIRHYTEEKNLLQTTMFA